MLNTNKTATAWREWLDAVNEQRDQLKALSPQLSDAREQRDRFQTGAYYYARAVAGAVRKHIGEQPEKADRVKVAGELRQGIQHYRKKHHDTAESVEWQRNLASLDECEKNLADAQQRLDDLTQQHDTAQSELDALTAQQPKASKSALDALDAEIEQADSDRERIEQALASMDNDGSAHRLAQEEAEQAQTRLDDLEADAALGNVNEGEQRAAQAALAKARTKAQKAQEDANRQASARRGLESRLAATAAQVEELRTIRNEVAIKIHAAALADAETKLVAYLDGEELRNLIVEVAKHQAALTSAQPGHSYGPARVEIKLPSLYYHADHQRLSQQRLEIPSLPVYG